MQPPRTLRSGLPAFATIGTALWAIGFSEGGCGDVFGVTDKKAKL